MYTDEFPGCCGARVLYCLDSEYFRQRQDCEPPLDDLKLMALELTKQIKSTKDLGVGALFATTNMNQTKTADLLSTFGFVKIADFSNPNHGHKPINLWFLNLVSNDSKPVP